MSSDGPDASAGHSPSPAHVPRLVLASASPRRQDLLRAAGYDFDILPADIDEDACPANALPADLSKFLAREKARAIARRRPGDVVLGADTVVALGDTPLGKPEDSASARAMLELLAGTTHIVITAVAVVHLARGFDRVAVCMSGVHMRVMTGREIDDYVAGGLWRGKAGGYGIQDPDPFVTNTAGSHSNIVGLPMELTIRMLAEADVHPARTGM